MEEWLRADKGMLWDEVLARMWTECASKGERGSASVFPKTALTRRMSCACIRCGLIGFHERRDRERQDMFVKIRFSAPLLPCVR